MPLGIRRRSVADERINGLGALDRIQSILPDKTQDRSWWSKGLEALAETAINLGTLGVVDAEFGHGDLIDPIFGGDPQPQGVRIGPGALLGPAGMLAPSVQFDLENRDVSLTGALPYLARQITRDDGGLAAPPGSGLSPNIVSSPPPDLYANLSSEQAGHVLNLRDSGDYSKTQLAENILNAPSREAQQILVQQSMGDLAARTGTPRFVDEFIKAGGELSNQDSPAHSGSGLTTSIVSELPDPYEHLSNAQTGHLLSLRDSASYTDQQRHAEITSAPPAQQTILAQQSLDQADAAAGESPTVICTELHRQGLIPEEWYKVDQKIGQQFWHSDPEVMIGYLSWGVPVAKLMAKSKIVTFLAKGLALKWAQEMYAQECKPELSTSAGRALCKYGPRICKFIGRRMSWQDLKEQ
jgi:hypothetical protein